MALSDLAVYSEYAYSTFSEVLRQQTDLFNQASEGTIHLIPAAMQGDYSETAFWGKVAGGVVRRRNAYGKGAVTPKDLYHKTDVAVKVAAGTPPINIDPGQMRWIQRAPEELGVALGQQLAKDSIADMLNIGIGACYSALVAETEVVHDQTAEATKTMTFGAMAKGQAKFGDASGQLSAWVMHSKTFHDLYQNNLANGSNLFTYGTVNVMRDPTGKVILVTDSPSFVIQGATTKYGTLGLVTGAIEIGQNNDFDANEETKNGDENITRTYQAEWSYNLRIKGFAWDKANGGKSPTDAAILSSTNWDRYTVSVKDLAGVCLITE